MLSPKHLSSWDVVEQVNVDPVPVDFTDDVEIASIASKDITQTFTFDRPICGSSSSSLLPPSPRFKLKSKLHRLSGSKFCSSSSLSRRSSSSSSTTSDEDDDDYESAFGPASELHSDPREWTPAQAREALVFARNQVLSSSELKKAGGNVLFFEGWTVTKLRKGTHTRIQIQYHGRPALARYSSPPHPTSPPFLHVLDHRWL